MILSLSKKELEERGCITADTLIEAKNRFKSALFCANEPGKMWDFLRKIWSLSPSFFYADFYYPILKPDQKHKFEQGLNQEELKMLAEFETEKKQVFFSVDREETLRFLFEITARNWLFSTFYIGDRKTMIWGNYDLSFPVFCRSGQVLEEYIKLGKECGLECQI